MTLQRTQRFDLVSPSSNAIRTIMSDEPELSCPACGTVIEDARRVGPVTFVLEPCSHQVDERLSGELSRDSE